MLFLPYLSGERTPYPDPLARGAWIGLTARHTRAHLTRAVLEGVAFGLKDCFMLLREVGIDEPREVRISGGGARSPLWRHILAAVLETELALVGESEGAAYGAALLAGVEVDFWQAPPDPMRDTPVQRDAPDPDLVAVYREAYPLYRGLYPALRGSFASLSALAAASAERASANQS